MEYANLPKYLTANIVSGALVVLGSLALIINVVLLIVALIAIGTTDGELVSLSVNGIGIPHVVKLAAATLSSVTMIIVGQLIRMVITIATDQAKQTLLLERLVARGD